MSMAADAHRPTGPIVRQCVRADGVTKVHHSTRAYARKAARDLRRNGDSAIFTVYRCPCGDFCVGRGAR